MEITRRRRCQRQKNTQRAHSHETAHVSRAELYLAVISLVCAGLALCSHANARLPNFPPFVACLTKSPPFVARLTTSLEEKQPRPLLWLCCGAETMSASGICVTFVGQSRGFAMTRQLSVCETVKVEDIYSGDKQYVDLARQLSSRAAEGSL